MGAAMSLVGADGQSGTGGDHHATALAEPSSNKPDLTLAQQMSQLGLGSNSINSSQPSEQDRLPTQVCEDYLLSSMINKELCVRCPHGRFVHHIEALKGYKDQELDKYFENATLFDQETGDIILGQQTQPDQKPTPDDDKAEKILNSATTLADKAASSSKLLGQYQYRLSIWDQQCASLLNANDWHKIKKATRSAKPFQENHAAVNSLLEPPELLMLDVDKISNNCMASMVKGRSTDSGVSGVMLSGGDEELSIDTNRHGDIVGGSLRDTML